MNDLIVAKVDKARCLLAECKNIPEVKRVVDMAHAAEVYGRRQKVGQEALNYAHAVIVDAETLLGDFLRTSEKATGGEHGGRSKKDGSRREPSNVTPTLASLGLSKKESSNAQFLSKLSVDTSRTGLQQVGEPTLEKPGREPM